GVVAGAGAVHHDHRLVTDHPGVVAGRQCGDLPEVCVERGAIHETSDSTSLFDSSVHVHDTAIHDTAILETSHRVTGLDAHIWSEKPRRCRAGGARLAVEPAQRWPRLRPHHRITQRDLGTVLLVLDDCMVHHDHPAAPEECGASADNHD